MEKKMVIIGAGSEARVVYDIFCEQGKEHSILGFMDPLQVIERRENYYDRKPLLGGKNHLIPFLKENDIKEAVLTLGDNAIRRTLYEQIKKETPIFFVSAVHPRAIVARSAALSEGVIIHAGAIVGVDAQIGALTLINTLASVDHDNRIGDFCHIAPGTHLAGNVTVGEESFLGVGVSVIPGITVGRQCTVGAGSVVLDSLPDGVMAVGIPARIIPKRNKFSVLGSPSPHSIRIL